MLHRRRPVEKSNSMSTFTYAKQYNDEGVSASEPPADPTHAVLSSNGHRRSPKSSTARDGQVNGRGSPGDRSPDVYTISGSAMPQPSKFGAGRWPLEPEVIVVERRLSGCDRCLRPTDLTGMPSCRCDCVAGYDVSARSRYYGYDEDSTEFIIRAPVTKVESPNRRRTAAETDVKRVVETCSQFPADGAVRRNEPLLSSSCDDFIIESTTFFTVPSTARPPSLPPAATTSASAASESPIYAFVDRRSRASAAAVDQSPSTGVVVSTAPDDWSPTRAPASERQAVARSVSIADKVRRRRDAAAASVADRRRFADDAVTTSIIAPDVGRPQPSAAVRGVRRTTATVSAGDWTAASSKSRDGGGMTLSDEYCTRVVDEAFGAIVNPVFDMELNN